MFFKPVTVYLVISCSNMRIHSMYRSRVGGDPLCAQRFASFWGGAENDDLFFIYLFFLKMLHFKFN